MPRGGSKEYFGKQVQRLCSRYKVDPKTGCWNWTGPVSTDGYGKFSAKRCDRAHRFSYHAFKGPIPDGLLICHHCDNRLCVNPAHLYAGTVYDNLADMVRRNRQPKNEDCVHSKMSWVKVRQMRELRGMYGCTHRELARHFSVSPALVSIILSDRAWREAA